MKQTMTSWQRTAMHPTQQETASAAQLICQKLSKQQAAATHLYNGHHNNHHNCKALTTQPSFTSTPTRLHLLIVMAIKGFLRSAAVPPHHQPPPHHPAVQAERRGWLHHRMRAPSTPCPVVPHGLGPLPALRQAAAEFLGICSPKLEATAGSC